MVHVEIIVQSFVKSARLQIPYIYCTIKRSEKNLKSRMREIFYGSFYTTLPK